MGPCPPSPLTGVSHDYATPPVDAQPEDVRSWEYGSWPRVEVNVPLTTGGTVAVFGEATRWTKSQILVMWTDDDGHYHSAWVPPANVRKLTASEWDIIEYDQCPPERRGIRWGNRFPGMLPE